MVTALLLSGGKGTIAGVLTSAVVAHGEATWAVRYEQVDRNDTPSVMISFTTFDFATFGMEMARPGSHHCKVSECSRTARLNDAQLACTYGTACLEWRSAPLNDVQRARTAALAVDSVQRRALTSNGAVQALYGVAETRTARLMTQEALAREREVDDRFLQKDQEGAGGSPPQSDELPKVKRTESLPSP